MCTKNAHSVYCRKHMDDRFHSHLKIRETFLLKIMLYRGWSNWNWDTDVTCHRNRSHQNTFLGQNSFRLFILSTPVTLTWAGKVPGDSKARYKMISLEMWARKYSKPEVAPKFSPGVHQESFSVEDVSEGWRMWAVDECGSNLALPHSDKCSLDCSCGNILHTIPVQTPYWCSWDSQAEQRLCPLGLTICVRKIRFN